MKNPVPQEWNNTNKAYNYNVLLQKQFEDQAQKTPDSIAISFNEQKVTYRELNNSANILAHQIIGNSDLTDTPVGICTDRSIEMVVGLYAILKSGGAYLPIDPDLPQKRIKYLINNSDIKIIITDEKNEPKILNYIDPSIIKIITYKYSNNIVDKPSLTAPKTKCTPSSLAYIMYTSGSTGNPKGVMIEHKSIVNRIIWMQDEYRMTSVDKVLQKTPYNFDVSVWEFFWPLSVGAQLVIALPGMHRDTAYLINTICQKNITHIHFVPSMLKAFLEEPGVNKCSCLKEVICSGEALPHTVQEDFFQKLNSSLHNLYGPTEASVDVTYWKCKPDPNGKKVPIGKPVANTQIYILDKNKNEVPINEIGEIYIGGIQIARGYFNNNELTSENFVPNPFKKDTFLYKTGDLGCWLENGSIDYIGRNDFQVQIRGLRVEPGEIEHALMQHPHIKNAVIIIDETHSQIQIIAFIILKNKITMDERDLRSFLERDLRSFLHDFLPQQMTPTVFHTINTIPLTVNGKIDRKSLIEYHNQHKNQNTSPQITSSNNIESKVINIWKNLLKIETFNNDDNFFDIGGHSILLIKLQKELQKIAPNKKITVIDLFEHTTISTITKYLTDNNVNTDK